MGSRQTGQYQNDKDCSLSRRTAAEQIQLHGNTSTNCYVQALGSTD